MTRSGSRSNRNWPAAWSNARWRRVCRSPDSPPTKPTARTWDCATDWRIRGRLCHSDPRAVRNSRSRQENDAPTCWPGTHRSRRTPQAADTALDRPQLKGRAGVGVLSVPYTAPVPWTCWRGWSEPAGQSRNASKRPRTRSAWTITRSASTRRGNGISPSRCSPHAFLTVTHRSPVTLAATTPIPSPTMPLSATTQRSRSVAVVLIDHFLSGSAVIMSSRC